MARPSKATRSGSREWWVWGKQCSSWLPAFLCHCQGHFPPPVTLQHCLLSSWCSWAKLEFQIQNWYCLLKEYSYCLSSSLVWLFHVPWRLSHANVNILPFMFHFKVFKKKKNLGWQWYVKKIITESHKRLKAKGFRTTVVNKEGFHCVLQLPSVRCSSCS